MLLFINIVGIRNLPKKRRRERGKKKMKREKREIRFQKCLNKQQAEEHFSVLLTESRKPNGLLQKKFKMTRS